MKKMMMTLAAVLCCAMTTTVFTSCGGDDDNGNGGGQQESEILGIGARYTVSVTKTMSELCDYSVTYYGNDNQLKTEAVTFTVNNDVAIWQKDVSSINLPAIFGLKLTATVKNDAQLDDVSISNIYPTAQNIYVEGISKDGKKLWSKNIDPRHNTSASTSTTGAKLVEYLSIINSHGGFLNASFSVDKDGKETSLGKIE